MTEREECAFCRATPSGLSGSILSNDGNTWIRCHRGIYEDDVCLAVLAPEQYTEGHSLVILKKHVADLADTSVSPDDLNGFISSIRRISDRLRTVVVNRRGQSPVRVYVCILCDGVRHLHAHLVPRYPFDEEDRKTYREWFGKDEIGPGFWFLGAKELAYNLHRSEFSIKSDQERVLYLEALATGIRLPK